MHKKLRLGLVLLLILALPCAALAEAKLGEYIYGAWSAWTSNRIIPSDKLDIETRTAREVVLKNTFTYERFIYFNVAKNRWYATNTDAPGGFMLPGSGRWERHSFDKPLAPLGLSNGEIEYEGHWFREVSAEVIDRFDPVTQYRARDKRLVACELEVHEFALGIGETHKLKYKLANGVSDIRFASSDANVATVNATGTVTALTPGSAEIRVMSGETQIESMQLVVGERIKTLAEGFYSLQQGVSSKFLAPRNGRDRAGTVLVASDSVKPDKRYFRFERADNGNFRIRLIGAPIVYMGENSKAPDPTLRLFEKGDDANTQVSLLRLKDGSCLISFAKDKTRFLGSNGSGVAVMKPYSGGDSTIGWRTTREAETAVTNGAWILPVVRNGNSTMSQNFNAVDHKGVDFGSKGERVSIVAAASGRVVYAFNGCEHDYPKKKDKNGKLSDPCGENRGHGNVVIIEHENGLRTTYAHLSRVKVKEGDRVTQGQVVGISGATGWATAIHLHFEVHSGSTPLDPRGYIELPKVGSVIKAK